MITHSNPVARGNGRCLLSLDAGGSRGISQLKILSEMMYRLNFGNEGNELKRPCDEFDMIGGVGSGGFIAILLVLFQMTPEEALEAFADLSVSVLDKQGVDAQARTRTLKEYIDNLLDKHVVDKNVRLLDQNGRTNRCKLAIPISYKRHVGLNCILRNYSVRQEQALNLTIAEALLVTVSTPPLFTSTSILKDESIYEYVGADLTLSNPAQEIIAEAHLAFGGEDKIACLLSLGCGYPGVVSLSEPSNIVEWNQFLERLTNDGERKARSLESQIGHTGFYYRFNITNGLNRSTSNNSLGPGDIVTHASVYIADTLISRRLDACINCLTTRDGLASLEQLAHPGGQTILLPQLPPLTKSFVMRKEPWEFVKKAILGPRDNENIDGPRMLVVTGMGGCGKTQLMLKFMKVYESEFASRHFIDGSSKERIRADVVRTVRALGVEHSQKDFEECLWYLAQPSPSGLRLLLYDNVDDRNLDLSPLLPQSNSCAIVITTRNHTLGESNQDAHLELDIMVMDEAIDLLLYTWKGSMESTEEARRDAKLVAEALGCLPIALQQARSYMLQVKCSARAYLERLSSNRGKLLGLEINHQLGTHSISTYAAFETSFGRLPLRVQKFLRLLSHFHWSNFPLELIVLAAKHQFYKRRLIYVANEDNFDSAKAMLQDIFLPNGEWDVTNLDEMTISLQSYSLTTVIPGIDTALLQMHPLVHDWVRSCTPKDEINAFQAAAALLLALGACEEYTASTQYLASHVMHMAPLWEQLAIANASSFADILHSNGVFPGALQLREKVVKCLRESLEVNDVRLSSSIWELALTYSNFGRLEEAEVLQKEVLKHYNEEFGEKHPDTVSARSNLAFTYGNLGRLKEAGQLHAEVLKVRKEILGEQHPDTIAALTNLAINHNDLGRVKEAEALHVEALKLRKELLGERHPDVIQSSRSLGVIYRDLGRLDEARAIQVEVLRLSTEVLGSYHPETINASHHLAITYREIGRLTEAEEIQKEVLKLRREVEGPQHPHVILALRDLATIFHLSGRLAEAEELAVEVLRLGTEISGKSHPETLRLSSNLAEIYRDIGRLDEAEVIQVEAVGLMREVLGEKHHKTSRAMLVLAEIYVSLHKQEQALEVLREAEAVISERLGQDHPQYLKYQRVLSEAHKLSKPSILRSLDHSPGRGSVPVPLLTMETFVLMFASVSIAGLVLYSYRR